MRRVALFGLVIWAGMLLAGCSVRPDDVRLMGVEGVEFKGLDRVDLLLRVDNRSRRRLTLSEAHAAVYRGTQELCGFTVGGRVQLERRSSQVVRIPLRITADDPLSIYTFVRSLADGGSTLSLSGEGVVRSGVIRRKIRVERYALAELLERCDLERLFE